MDLREEARHYFNETLGLSYQDITEGDLVALQLLLNQTFKKYRESVNVGPLTISRKFQQTYHKDGSLKRAFLFVNGGYFKDRESISFNEDGFIGFCGWASDRSAEPFVEAFKQWCDYLSEAK